MIWWGRERDGFEVLQVRILAFVIHSVGDFHSNHTNLGQDMFHVIYEPYQN